jgi:3'(2'), 5'-bisphosphate nucleotidase
MGIDDSHADDIAKTLAAIAIEAGRLLCGMERAVTTHQVKPDGSPTTRADLAAETLIIGRLDEAFPGVPVVAEETAPAVACGSRFFLVDPLDGTRDYIGGTGEYTVNIALIENGRPVAAVVSAPAMGRIWLAGAVALEAAIPRNGETEIVWRDVTTRRAPADDLIALVSRRHGDQATEACLSTLSIGTRRTASSALKFCLIASGEADVYIRCGPTMEWDTAAGDHILSRAGGCVIGPGGAPLTYGQDERGYRNGPFAALGDVTLAPKLSLPAVAA